MIHRGGQKATCYDPVAHFDEYSPTLLPALGFDYFQDIEETKKC